MTELEFIFRRICKRRGKTLAHIDSVAFNVLLIFGLANNTPLLPVVANVFYWIEQINWINTNAAGTPELILATNSGQGSAGGLSDVRPLGSSMNWHAIECDSLLYSTTGHTSGHYYGLGTVFKITYV